MKPDNETDDLLNGTPAIAAAADNPGKKGESKSRSERRQEFWKNKKKKIKDAQANGNSESEKNEASPRKRLRNRDSIAKPDSLNYQPNLNRGFHSKVIQSLSKPKKNHRENAKSKPQFNSEKKKSDSSEELKIKKPKPAPSEDSTEVFDSYSFSMQLINGDVDSFKSTEVTESKKYVLFISNLPYNVTKEQLEEHFRKTGGIKAIRIPKERGKDVGKGFAYMEFDGRISHGIALRLHHTTLRGHKINVEFTTIDGNTDSKKKTQMRRRMR